MGRAWTLAPADVPHAGDQEWASVAGIPPGHPLVAGPQSTAAGGPGIDVDAARGLTVTQGGVSAPQADMGGAATASFDDWRDLLDWRNSPAPYIAVATLAMIGLIAARVEIRGGPANVRASLG